MKKNSSGVITGLVLILIGLVIVCRAFDLFDLDLSGWWTGFIIIPCLIGVINSRGGRFGYLVGMGLGIILLCCARGWVRWGMFAPTLLAVVFVLIGLNMIIGSPSSKKHIGDNTGSNRTAEQDYAQNGAGGAFARNTAEQAQYTFNPNTNTYDTNNVQMSDVTGAGSNAATENFNQGSTQKSTQQGTQGKSSNYENCVCTAVLCGRDIRYDGEVFRGAMLSALLGGIELDLRHAIISGEVVIEAKSVLAGIEIWVPHYARVIVNGTPVLGSIENGTKMPAGCNGQTPVITINGACVLASIEVK